MCVCVEVECAGLMEASAIFAACFVLFSLSSYTQVCQIKTGISSSLCLPNAKKAF